MVDSGAWRALGDHPSCDQPVETDANSRSNATTTEKRRGGAGGNAPSRNGTRFRIKGGGKKRQKFDVNTRGPRGLFSTFFCVYKLRGGEEDVCVQREARTARTKTVEQQ